LSISLDELPSKPIPVVNDFDIQLPSNIDEGHQKLSTEKKDESEFKIEKEKKKKASNKNKKQKKEENKNKKKETTETGFQIDTSSWIFPATESKNEKDNITTSEKKKEKEEDEEKVKDNTAAPLLFGDSAVSSFSGTSDIFAPSSSSLFGFTDSKEPETTKEEEKRREQEQEERNNGNRVSNRY